MITWEMFSLLSISHILLIYSLQQICVVATVLLCLMAQGMRLREVM